MSEVTSAGDHVLDLTVDIVASHVSNNVIPHGDVRRLIREVYEALSDVRNGNAAGRPTPAVPADQSVQPDYIVCLEDGKKLKMLKRHLRTAYGMSPEEYRARWGLPSDYPMVAPNYARRRQALAKEIGLGTKRGRR